MIKVVNSFSYNQTFVPSGLSALAHGLYTCIKLSIFKPAASPNFTFGCIYAKKKVSLVVKIPLKYSKHLQLLRF